MSLLSHDQVRILLGPEGVAMMGLPRGQRTGVVARHAIPPAENLMDAPPWRLALESLEAGLQTLNGKRMDATIVLSNHFVRYELVPWSDQISDEYEEQAFVRHSFVQTYGDDAKHWAMRLSPSDYGEKRVASAIDQGLLDGLERVTKARGLQLVSMQPYLMTVFNRWRHRLHKSSLWFVVVEPGRLCVSQLRHGHWCSLQMAKVGDDWPETLKLMLERELLLTESGTGRGAVYVFAPGYTDYSAFADSGWTIYLLGANTGTASNADLQFAMTASDENLPH